jgi:hypothetical protein
MECRISKCRISIQSTIVQAVPVRKCRISIQSTIVPVRLNRDSAFRNSAFRANRDSVNHCTAYSSRHETSNLDWKAEFRFAESRFSQRKYLFVSILISLLVQWLTESRFGKTQFGFPIEIRSRVSGATLRSAARGSGDD